MPEDDDDRPGQLLVFHPDCGGMLKRGEGEKRQYFCDKCGTRVSVRDRSRIIHHFIRPGTWAPLDPP
jgi:hypothetical protein